MSGFTRAELWLTECCLINQICLLMTSLVNCFFRWSTDVVCNKFCHGRNRARPSLQCVACKSFYHPECVFFDPKDVKKIKDTYTCTVSEFFFVSKCS